MSPFVFVAEQNLPDLGIRAGNVVIVRPGEARPVVIEHEAPANYGRILAAAEAGALRYITPDQPLAALRAAVGSDLRPAPSPPHPEPVPHLTLVRP